MPRGELYIKTARISEVFNTSYSPSEMFTSECRFKAGLVVDEANPMYGYADAYVRYGLSLSDGSVDKLMSYNPRKSPKGVSLATTNGVSYDGNTVGVCDERTLSIDVNMTAPDRIEYMRRRELLKREVLYYEKGQVIILRTKYLPDVYYRLVFQACEPYRQWMSGGAAMMTLAFIEPHPELQEVRLVSFS